MNERCPAFRIALRLALLVAVSSCGTTQPDVPTEGAFAAISVSDHDAMVAWYTTNLGFDIESSETNAQRRGSLLSRNGMLLEIAQFEGARQRSVESHEIHGMFKLGFLVADIDANHAELVALGVDMFFPIVEAGGGRLRTFGIRDPEGNIVQFFARTTEWAPGRTSGPPAPPAAVQRDGKAR